MTQTAKLTASSATISGAVTISGDTVVAGGEVADDNDVWHGRTFVFTKPGGQWANMTETFRLDVPGAAASCSCR